MNLTITPSQIKRLHALLNKADKMHAKSELVLHFSKGRTNSSKGLSYMEANTFIKHLESFVGTPKRNFTPESESADRMRKKIIGMAYDLNWQLPGGKMDMDHINQWCIKSGMFHKELNAHTDAELTQLVTQFEKVRTSFLKAIANGK